MSKAEHKELERLEWLNKLGTVGYLTAEQCRLNELRKKATQH